MPQRCALQSALSPAIDAGGSANSAALRSARVPNIARVILMVGLLTRSAEVNQPSTVRLRRGKSLASMNTIPVGRRRHITGSFSTELCCTPREQFLTPVGAHSLRHHVLE